MKRLRPVLTVVFVFIALTLFLSFATYSHAITITGSDEIKCVIYGSRLQRHCIVGCHKHRPSISSNGVLTAGSASCGGITVTAHCSDGSIATKTARVTDAGTWIQVEFNDCLQAGKGKGDGSNKR